MTSHLLFTLWKNILFTSLRAEHDWKAKSCTGSAVLLVHCIRPCVCHGMADKDRRATVEAALAQVRGYALPYRAFWVPPCCNAQLLWVFVNCPCLQMARSPRTVPPATEVRFFQAPVVRGCSELHLPPSLPRHGRRRCRQVCRRMCKSIGKILCWCHR